MSNDWEPDRWLRPSDNKTCPLLTCYCQFPSTLIMAEEQYLAVLKASYDYEPRSEEEIEIKEDQLLFLLERTDEE